MTIKLYFKSSALYKQKVPHDEVSHHFVISTEPHALYHLYGQPLCDLKYAPMLGVELMFVAQGHDDQLPVCVNCLKANSWLPCVTSTLIDSGD